MESTKESKGGDTLNHQWEEQSIAAVESMLNEFRAGRAILADDEFINFFMDMFRSAYFSSNEVSICDSTLVKLLLGPDSTFEVDMRVPDDAMQVDLPAKHRSEVDRVTRAVEKYRELFAPARTGSGSPQRLILAPFHSGVHWSLLVYDAHESARAWFLYDSYEGSGHLVQASRFLALLAERGIIDWPAGGVTKESWVFAQMLAMTPRISMQPQAWECGYFVLMYAFRLLCEDQGRKGRQFAPLEAVLDGPRCTMRHMQSAFATMLSNIIAVYRQHLKNIKK